VSIITLRAILAVRQVFFEQHMFACRRRQYSLFDQPFSSQLETESSSLRPPRSDSASQPIRSSEKDSGLYAGSLSVRSTWSAIPDTAAANAQPVEGKSWRSCSSLAPRGEQQTAMIRDTRDARQCLDTWVMSWSTWARGNSNGLRVRRVVLPCLDDRFLNTSTKSVVLNAR
jgi:hypothetical protein